MALHPRKPCQDILSVSFNQSGECFTCALSNGFRIYTTYPFDESYRREFIAGGFKRVEMMFKSNIVALVGGGEIPKFPPNKVILWDDHQGRAIGELSYRTAVRDVKLRKNRIAVALDTSVHVYDLEDLRQVHTAETVHNPLGLLAMSSSPDSIVVVHPGTHIGELQVDMLDAKRSKTIQAHNRNLAALALTHHGKFVATASEKGTLIRIFSTQDGSKIREVRRGTDPAIMYSLAFSFEDAMPHWLASTSDKGTLHVFDLRGDEEDAEEGFQLVRDNVPSVSQQKGPLSVLRRMLPGSVGTSYLLSERSWAQFHLPDANKCIASFDTKYDGLVFIISTTGAYHCVEFDVNARGMCSSVAHSLFLTEDHHEESIFLK